MKTGCQLSGAWDVQKFYSENMKHKGPTKVFVGLSEDWRRFQVRQSNITFMSLSH